MRINDDSQKKYISSVVASLRTSGNVDTVTVLKKATPVLQDTRYDGWDQGTWFYTLYLYLKLSEYNQLTETDRTKHAAIVLNVYGQLFNDGTDVLDTVIIKPLIEQHLDWDALKGSQTKQSLLEKLSTEKSMLIEVGTGIKMIQECEGNYKSLHKKIKSILSALLLEHPLDYNSLWEWHNYYKTNIGTYIERRRFINEKYRSIIDLIDKSEVDSGNTIVYEPTGWGKIDKSVQLLNGQLLTINDRIDLNQIGLRCRETIIILAKEVYDDNIHHPLSFSGTVSSTDSVRMLEGYIEYHFKGAENEEKRKYAKTANDLANNLTHKQTAALVDAKLCLSATLALISIIKIIHTEFADRKVTSL